MNRTANGVALLGGAVLAPASSRGRLRSQRREREWEALPYSFLSNNSLQSPHMMLRRASVRGDTRITAGGEQEHTALT